MQEGNKIDLDIEKVVKESELSVKKGKKLKKHQKAKSLVAEAKSLVKKSENELQDCKLLLEDDIKEYVEALEALKRGGLDESKEFLAKIGDIDLDISEIEVDDKVFEAKEDLEPLHLKEVSSGRFTGFLLSLLGGMATLGGLIYWATEKLGMTLDITKIPSNETVQTILGWFGTQVGRENDVVVGGVVVGVVVLAVMTLLYMIRVSLKGSSNLNFAKKQMKETQKYVTKKTDCKAEMDRVDAHIMQAVKVLKDYEVVLNEQVGKLKRIFHFENDKNSLSKFQQKSIDTIKDTKGLIENIQKFISTPMSEEGKLSEWNVKALKNSKDYLEQLLKEWSK
jgi:hypothetical protein